MTHDAQPPLSAVTSDAHPAQRALELFALQHVEVLPVVSDEGALVGLLDRRAILGAYRRRVDELRGHSVATQ